MPERAVSLQATEAKSHTLEQCARKYIEARAPGWKSAKHAAQWSSTLERYAYPAIGKRDVADVTSTLVLEILRPIWATKTETATRVRGRIESLEKKHLVRAGWGLGAQSRRAPDGWH